MKIALVPIFALLTAFLGEVLAISEAVTWSGTSQIQAGYKNIVLNQVHQRSDNLYTYTYSPAFSTTPFTALGIIDFEATDLHVYSIKYLVNIPNYMSSSNMQILMNYPSGTAWRSFKVSYIAIDSAFTSLKVDYFAVSNPSNIGSGIGSRSYSGIFNFNIGFVDVSHRISIMPLLVGLTATSVNGQHAVALQTTLKNSYSIDYKISVQRTTQVFQLNAYILIVDRTVTENCFQIYMDEIYVTGTDNSAPVTRPIFYSVTNFHAGINSFNFELVSFSFDRTTFTLSTGGFYNSISITVWNFRERHCSVAAPYYEETSNMCYDSCPDGYINTNGPSKQYCQSCDSVMAACEQCTSDGLICSDCWGNYILNTNTNNSCICPDGYYVSSLHEQYVDKCRICHISCLTCTGPDSNQCTSCGRFRTFDGLSCPCDYGTRVNGQCVGPCDDLGCIQCDADLAVCEVCDTSFTLSGSRCICGPRMYYHIDLIACLPCHSSCLYCTGPNYNQCEDCDRPNDRRYLDTTTDQCICISNYEDVNETCQPRAQLVCTEPGYYADQEAYQCKQICGDGLLIENQCDDGNQRSGDGCSPTCQIQTGFQCADNTLAPSRRSYCSFVGQIQFSLEESAKHIYKNRLNLTYSMKPVLRHVLEVYPQLTPNVQFQPASFGVKVRAARYLASEQVLEVEVDYEEDLQGKNLTIVFSIPQTAETFAVAVSRSSHEVDPSNNLAAMAYSKQEYKKIRISQAIGMVVYIGGLIITMLLLFFRKMIGLEYICMLQLVYFSSLITDYSNPLLGPLQEWRYVNGYNNMSVNINGTALVQNEFKVLNYYNYFYANFNVMLFICLVVYLLALILFLLSLISERTTERKLKDASKFFAMETGFAFMVFSLNNIITSIVMEYQSGLLLDFRSIANKLILMLSILIVLAHAGLFLLRAHEYSDSILFYHRHKPSTHFFPFAFILRNATLMAAILLEQYLREIATHMCLGIEVIYWVSVVTAKPYRKNIDYVRFGAVEATLTICLLSRFVEANFVNSPYDSRLSTLLTMCVYLTLAGLLISWALTVASFVYHFLTGKSKEIQVIPENDYIPPVIQSPKKKKAPKSKEQSPINQFADIEKARGDSKEFVVFDIEDGLEEDNTGGSDGNLNSAYYDQSSRRKFRPKKASQYY